MSQRGSGRIEVGPDDALPDLLLRVKATRGDEAVIAIPDDIGILLTATEFRTLKATADQVRVAITLETNDKLRAQLASMFGFAHEPFLSEDAQEVVDEHPSWPTPDSRLAPSRVSIPIGDLTTSKPWRDEPVDASSGISVPPKPVPRPEFALEPRTGSIAKQAPEARARTKPATIIGIAVAVLLAVLVAAVLSVVLRTAEITVRTPRQPVSTQLVVGYSTDGSDVPGATITLPATTEQFTVPYSAPVPATGMLDNQGGKASGTVQLRNISGKAVTVPAGTRLQMADGVVYLTSTNVSVPTGDADKPGQAEVGIQAEKPGTVGNRDSGTFTGQVEAVPGVYFGNPGTPISGGTDVLIKVVTDQDLENARDAAIASMNQSAKSFQLPDGRIVIPSTVQTAGDPSVQTDHAAGEQFDTFNVTGQATYQAQTISPADLPAQMQADLRNQLITQVPSGYILTSDPIAFTSPVEQAAGSGLMTVAVTVDAAEQLNPDRIDQIKTAASGKSEADARQAIGGIEGVEVVDISVSPALLDKTLPGASKIDVKAE
jgi:baseplate J-like protein